MTENGSIVRSDQRDAAGVVEARGAEYIPEDQRSSRPRELAWVFFGTQLCFGIIVLGSVPVALGLGWWSAVTSTLVGLAVGSLVFGAFATLGMRTGTNSPLSSGAHFGVVGRLVGTGIGLFTGLGFFSLTVWTGGQAIAAGATALVGIPVNTLTLSIGYALIAACAILLAVYGHASVVVVNRWVIPAMGILLVIGFIAIAPRFTTAEPASGYLLSNHTTTWLLAATAGASLPISYTPYACDYTRYISGRRWSGTRVFAMGTIGIFLGCAFALVFGIYVTTTFIASETDWVTGLVQASPTWYGLVVLLVGLVGGVAQGAVCVYGTGLDLSSLLPSMSRVGSTVLLGAVATLFVFVGSLVISLLEFVTAFVLVLVVITAPWVVINLLGHALCRGGYHVHDLQILTESPRLCGGSYWYWHGWNIPAVTAWLVGTVFGLLCVHTTLFVGPWSNIAGGVDISFIAAGLLGGLLYLGLRRLMPGHEPGPSLFSPRPADAPATGNPQPTLAAPPNST